ncbi:MAG: glycosyltransferase family 4 protein [Candidatus Saganbacteria bacterium]|nr:glycosyltransferase family 4 protein [Candidatus Saganbacteria bacterium]
MKIVWVMPSKRICGGIRVIFEYANRLSEQGHQVICVCPFEQFPYPQNWAKRAELWLREKIYYPLKLRKSRPHRSKADWFPLKAELIEVPDLSAKNIPDADVVIATAWETAEWVNTYPGRCGTKFYFIQGYEIWAAPKERVDLTYKLPLKKITIASWLSDKMAELGEQVYAKIINGINLDLFYNNDKKYHQPRRIGLLYHGAVIKGVADGLKAFSLARQRFPDIQLVMFGVKRDEHRVPIPAFAEFHEKPPQNKLRDIYSSLDIFLSPSWSEGCQLPPMEAMACKAAVVATNVGGIPDYAIAGRTALVSEPHAPEAMAKNIISLLENEEKLKDVSEAGYEYIKQFNWDNAARRLEEILTTQR